MTGPPDGLARRHDDTTEHQQTEGETAGEDHRAERERSAHQEGQAEYPVDDRRHRGQVLDVELDEAVVPASRPRTPRGRWPWRPTGTMNSAHTPISQTVPQKAAWIPD